MLLFALVACNDAPKTATVDESATEVTTNKSTEKTGTTNNLESKKIRQDGTNVDQDTYVTKYVAIDELTASEADQSEKPKPTFTNNKVVKEPAKIKDIDAKINMETTKDLPPITLRYRTFGNDINMDRPPVFSKDCLSAANVSECTEAAIRDYIKSNLDYPETALEEGHDGFEKVTFVVDNNGKVGSDIKVASKDKPCEGCAKASVEVVANMPNWLPALENGKPVSTEVTIPIRFDYKGTK